MFVTRLPDATEHARDGLVSKLLVGQEGSVARLTVTWVVVDPDREQAPHAHESEQVYVVVHGTGRMQVESESADLAAGDAVWIPGGIRHGIENTGRGQLVYVTAATPAMDVSRFYG